MKTIDSVVEGIRARKTNLDEKINSNPACSLAYIFAKPVARGGLTGGIAGGVAAYFSGETSGIYFGFLLGYVADMIATIGVCIAREYSYQKNIGRIIE